MHLPICSWYTLHGKSEYKEKLFIENTALRLYSLMSWRRKWQPPPVFFPGESHGWRTLAGYHPQGRKESDTSEHICSHAHTQFDKIREYKEEIIVVRAEFKVIGEYFVQL